MKESSRPKSNSKMVAGKNEKQRPSAVTPVPLTRRAERFASLLTLRWINVDAVSIIELIMQLCKHETDLRSDVIDPVLIVSLTAFSLFFFLRLSSVLLSITIPSLSSHWAAKQPHDSAVPTPRPSFALYDCAHKRSLCMKCGFHAEQGCKDGRREEAGRRRSGFSLRQKLKDAVRPTPYIAHLRSEESIFRNVHVMSEELEDLMGTREEKNTTSTGAPVRQIVSAANAFKITRIRNLIVVSRSTQSFGNKEHPSC